MGEDVQTFRICQNQGEVDAVTSLLEEAGIAFTAASSAAHFDITAIGSERTGQIAVRIRARDFETANALLLEKAENALTEVPADHYFHDYADHELLEVLSAAHEWNEYDVACAKFLLTQRGYDLSGGEVREMQEKRIAVERTGRQGSRVFLIFGFLCGTFGGFMIWWCPLGVVALLIGWSFCSMKETDPSGDRYFAYDVRTRIEGKYLICFTVAVLCIWMVVYIVSDRAGYGP